MAVHMAEHLDAANTLQDAIVDGRLMDARDRATWFAEHPMMVPARASGFVTQMRHAALAVAEGRDVPEMARHLGELGHACAACHVQERATVALPATPAPAEGSTTLAAQMKRHAWAANRMWEGVFMPDPLRWQAGARVLASVTIDARGGMHETPDAEVVGLAEQLRAHAIEASTLTDPAAEARFYGKLLDTCASCHTRVRMTPVVSDSPRP